MKVILLNSFTTGDQNMQTYTAIKSKLTKIKELESNIRFAYIYFQRDGSIYILADSEDSNSADYSPPMQLYAEANPEYFRPFYEGTIILTDPVNDRWGRWISVLIPIVNPSSGEISAVFGVDFPVDHWKSHAIVSTLQTGILSLFIIIVYSGLFLIIAKNKRLKYEKEELYKLSKKLNENETLLRSIFEQAPVGIAIVSGYAFTTAPTNYINVNPMFEKITGRSKTDLLNTEWTDISHPEDLPADLEFFRKFKSGEIPGYEMDKRFIRPDGSAVWVRMLISPLELPDARDFHLCLIEDISKRKELERELIDTEKSRAIFMDNLPGMMYRYRLDDSPVMEYVSNGCYELTAYTPESLLKNNVSFLSLVSPKYKDWLLQKWEEAFKNHVKLHEEYELITASGKTKWVWEQGQGIYDDMGKVVAIEGIIMDITERKNNELRLKFLSEHDELTGLLNIRSFEKIYSMGCASDTSKRALIMVTIRRFSVINSVLGYRYSEDLITNMARCLGKLDTDRRLLFYLPPKYFIYYLPDYQDQQELIDFSNEIAVNLDYGIEQLSTSFSIGILEIDLYAADNAETAIKNVSIAAENTDSFSRFVFSFFNEKAENRQIRDNRIRDSLSHLLLGGDDVSLSMRYQPIVDLRSDRIVGFEALARYSDKDLGIISPAEFIPVAEETQLMTPLGNLLMRIAFKFAVTLKERGHPGIFVSLNISAVQLLDESFLDELEQALDETGANPGNVIIELTETVFSDNYSGINEKLEKIKALGIRIAIDDFGTGYSSLARQRELKTHVLKIDRYFIDKLLVIDADFAITGDIIDMAHKLGQLVIAEGVEEEKQQRYLLEHQCDMMQGYLFSKPVDQNAAFEMLDDQELHEREVKQ